MHPETVRQRLDTPTLAPVCPLFRERIGACLCPDLRRRLIDGDLLVTPALELVREWADPRSLRHAAPVLVLTGDVGVGKTVAAIDWLVRSEKFGALARASDVVWMAASPESEVRASFDALLDVPNLVVDNLFGEGELDDVRRAFLELFKYRQRPGLRTILIGIGTVEEFVERYAPDDRLLDLLRAEALVVAIKGESMRRNLGLFPTD